MSTTATVTDMAVKPEVFTAALITVTTPDGVDASGAPKNKVEVKAITNDKDIDLAKKAGTLLFEQTMSYDKPGTLEGMLQVTKGDLEESLQIFYAGMKASRINPRVKNLLEAVDEEGNPTFQPVEGSYDIRDLIAEPAQRRNLSPTDKAVKVLMGLGLTKEAALGIISQSQTALAGGAASAAA